MENKAAPPVRTSYLKEVMCTKNLAVTVRRVTQAVQLSGLKFNAIAFRGMSGALVAPMVAVALKKGILCCRKESENSHACMGFEGLEEGGDYIIIDDFVRTGSTIVGIMKVLDDFQRCNTIISAPFNPVGLFLYGSWESETRRKSFPRHLDTHLAVYPMNKDFGAKGFPVFHVPNDKRKDM